MVKVRWIGDASGDSPKVGARNGVLLSAYYCDPYVRTITEDLKLINSSLSVSASTTFGRAVLLQPGDPDQNASAVANLLEDWKTITGTLFDIPMKHAASVARSDVKAAGKSQSAAGSSNDKLGEDQATPIGDVCAFALAPCPYVAC